MPHQNVNSPKATAQNAAVPSSEPNDKGREQSAAVRPEPSSYVAQDYRDATVAAPAAGETPDYMDEGDAFDGEAVHQGATNTLRDRNADAGSGQGPKTRAANRRIVKSGRA